MAAQLPPHRFEWREADPTNPVCPSCDRAMPLRFEWGLRVLIRVLPFTTKGKPTSSRPGTHHGSYPCRRCSTLIEVATERRPEAKVLPDDAAPAA